MRKDFIDNIRIICIMLLFPYHTCMIYNNWGEIFYVTGVPYKLPSYFVSIVYPWWMTLLFTIAGISSYYAFKKRTMKEYTKERVEKLLIPLLVGLVVILPLQSYIADIFHNGYSGGYFEHYKVFFTRYTYLTGQDGGFTPGHLWFMLYLFTISMIMLPFMNKYIKSSRKLDGSKSVLVVLGYLALKYTNIIWIQFSIIMIGSFIITIMCYEVFKRFKISSFLFGIKKV